MLIDFNESKNEKQFSNTNKQFRKLKNNSFIFVS